MLTSFLYRKGKPLETHISRAQMLQALQEKDALLWVDFDDPDDFECDALVEIFNFHDLAIEDCLGDISHPKVDDYEEYLFLVAHALGMDSEKTLKTTELDLFLGKNYVVTYHQKPIPSVIQLRESAAKKPDTHFGFGTDRLVHAVLDKLVDSCLPVIDEYDRKIDAIEDEIFNGPDSRCLAHLLQVKRDIFHLRRIVAPQRDMLTYLTRNPSPFIKPKNQIYFRDVYDHLFSIYGIAEGFHENLNMVLQAYYSSSSHRLNEVIKRMTVLATLSMPAVMIASIYGMNFQSMPELAWKYGYFISLGLMGVISAGMLVWMKWKKWI